MLVAISTQRRHLSGRRRGSRWTVPSSALLLFWARVLGSDAVLAPLPGTLASACSLRQQTSAPLVLLTGPDGGRRSILRLVPASLLRGVRRSWSLVHGSSWMRRCQYTTIRVVRCRCGPVVSRRRRHLVALWPLALCIDRGRGNMHAFHAIGMCAILTSLSNYLSPTTKIPLPTYHLGLLFYSVFTQ